MVGARELPLGEAPALHATVAALAALAGLPKPRSTCCPTASRARSPPAAGRAAPRSRSAAGCSRAAPPAELEGVLAHELAHIRNRDVARPDARWSWSRRARRDEPRRRLARSARCCSCSARSPRRSSTCCSRRSASSRPTAPRPTLCGSPHGLADALLRLEQAAELVEFRASPATEPLYTFNPFAEEGLAALFVTHPPVGERVRRLRDARPGLAREARAAA